MIYEIECTARVRVQYVPHAGLPASLTDPGEKPWVEVMDVTLTGQGQEDVEDAVSRQQADHYDE